MTNDIPGQEEPSDDGGAAFPTNALHVPFEESDAKEYQGMSLRDYFAAKALHAVYSDKDEVQYWCAEYSPDEAWEFCAERAYKLADAMLRARKLTAFAAPDARVTISGD